MPRFHRLAGAVAFALGCAGAAQAQQFSGFIVFGDSLSDSGNIALAQGLPPGNSFTTNPDPVAAEIIAAAFGLPGGPSLGGGLNFAWGGACARAGGPCLNPVPNIPTQVTQYLATTGGVADPNALYSIWGGANDIFATLTLDPLNAQANTVAAATAYVQQIGRLQAAGANYIVVYNLPNLGATPQFAGPSASAVSQITVVYNSALNAGLASLGDGIISINTFGLIAEISANPGLYGFTNITGQACGVGSSSVACGPAGSGLPFTYAPGTNDTWLFADGVHPTGAAHRILANVVLSTIAAPIQVSYAGEGGIQIAENHGRATNEELMADFQLDREVGSVRGYATAQYAQQDYDYNAGTNILGGEADVLSLTLGANHRFAENAYWGLAVTLGNHDNDVASATLDTRTVLGSLSMAYRFGGGYINGGISGGNSVVDIERFIEMGATTRVETSSANVSQVGANFGLGWLFGSAGGLQHGPFVNAAWVEQQVDAFSEDNGTATSMNYSAFDRDSLIYSAGYQLMGNFGSTERAMRPYARVAFNEEQEDDQILVNAGNNSMPGRFTIGGFTPSSDWLSAELGVNFSIGENIQAFAAYTGRFSDDQQERNSVSLGMRVDF